MRFHQIQKLIEQEQEMIDEVRMGSSDFARFLKTPLAKSMNAGFEAEVIFSDLADDSYEEYEPDWDFDRSARSIADIIAFFSGGDYSDMSSRDIDRLNDRMNEDYLEWQMEQIDEKFNREQESIIRDYIMNEYGDDMERELVEEYLSDEMGLSEEEIEKLFTLKREYTYLSSSGNQRNFIENHPEYKKYQDAVSVITDTLEEIIDDRVQQAIDEQNDDWEAASDEFREDMHGDLDERQWLRSVGLDSMNDIRDWYDLTWPYMMGVGGEGGFNESAAEDLANDLSDTLGVETTVSGGYHSAKRDSSTWIFEPDSSLDPDNSEDMPVEIVSPPMPLEQTVEILPKFFKWVKDNNGYVNKSTGFHMSVSMPNHDESKLDYTKLALFLGDEYVLRRFGRELNTYAKSAIQKIKAKTPDDPEDLAEYLELMKREMSVLARENLADSSGFGKYTSINPKTGYVEFRSAGGENYMDDMKLLQDTLTRYGMALSIAMDPTAERQEYAKKLYKLLNTGVKREDDVISLFSRYVAKDMPLSALKSHLKLRGLQRDNLKSKQTEHDPDRFARMVPLNQQNPNYEIYNARSDNVVYPFNASNDTEALAALSAWRTMYMDPSLDWSHFTVRSVRRARGSSTDTTSQSDQDTGTQYPFLVTYRFRGRSAGNYRVDASNESQARAKFMSQLPDASRDEVEVISVSHLR